MKNNKIASIEIKGLQVSAKTKTAETTGGNLDHILLYAILDKLDTMIELLKKVTTTG